MSDKLINIASDIVSSFASNNSLSRSELVDAVAQVHSALSRLGQPIEAEPEALTPAVSIKKSVTDDAITCLACGKKFKSLKRHIGSEHGETPAEYRAKWGLPSAYPMVAPTYAAQRSELARSAGLGQMRKKAAEPEAEAPKKAAKKPGRKAKSDA